MTYHLEQMLQAGKYDNYQANCNFDRNFLFPEKLWEALESDSDILKWTEDGKGVMVDSEKFEPEVMDQFPGLVQIAQFLNFRRQMRWYGFAWEQRTETCFIFYHPFFLRNRKELIGRVKARKRSLSASPSGYTPRRRGRPPIRVNPNILVNLHNNGEAITDMNFNEQPIRKKRKYVRRKLIINSHSNNENGESQNCKITQNNGASSKHTEYNSASGSSESERSVMTELEAIGNELMTLRRTLEWLCLKIANKIPSSEELYSVPMQNLATDTSVCNNSTFIAIDMSIANANKMIPMHYCNNYFIGEADNFDNCYGQTNTFLKYEDETTSESL